MFTQQTYSVNEGGTSQVCLFLNQAPHESVTVNVSTLSDGLASGRLSYVHTRRGEGARQFPALINTLKYSKFIINTVNPSHTCLQCTYPPPPPPTYTEGSDYVGFTQGITFIPPATDGCVEVEALSDSRLEGTESFTVMMSSDDSVVILPTMSTATVDIIDQTGMPAMREYVLGRFIEYL